MAYLHEMALKNAQKKLYMLGSSDKRRDKTSFEDVGGAATGAIKSMRAKQAQGLLKRQMEAQARMPLPDYKPQTEDTAERRAVVEGNALPVSPMQAAQYAEKAHQINEAADKTRIAGSYSPNGLEATDSDAQANAADRFRSRQLIGIGGSLSPNQFGPPDPRLDDPRYAPGMGPGRF